jgi:hypothetical protein
VPFDRELIEAKLALNLIASADMPSIAWEAGLDGGSATRRLGALECPTYFEVSEVLPRVMEELGLSHISRDEAALRMARRIAKEILESGDDPLQHFRDFESLWIRAGYPHEIGGVGTLYNDVWIAQSTAQSETEIRESAMSTIRKLLEPLDTV